MDGITIFLICLLGVFLIYSIFLMFRRKKADKENLNMLDKIKAGDKVRTHVGVFGTVISISETTIGKTVVIETGDNKNKCRLEMDYRVIAGLDDKQLAIYDENNNLITNTKTETKTIEKTTEPVKLEEVAVKLSDVEIKLEEPGALAEMQKDEKKEEIKQKKTKKTTK